MLSVTFEATEQRYGNGPVKSPCKDEIIIGRELVQGGIEVSLENQATGFIDNDKRVDRPGSTSVILISGTGKISHWRAQRTLLEDYIIPTDTMRSSILYTVNTFDQQSGV